MALSAGLLPTVTAVIVVCAAYSAFATVLLVCARRAGQLLSFGPANAVTSIRAALATVLIGAIADPADALQGWWPFALALAVLVLDGVDGMIARRRGRATAFGARFDMEIDAALVLILSLLLATAGKAGPWIVAAGLMRYLLLLAAFPWPKLARPLPPSRRRSAVCALTVAALAACLMPVIASGLGNAIAGGALLALTLSFGKDLIWLLTTEPENRTA